MNVIGSTFFGFIFIFAMTTLGSAIVFFFRNPLKPSINSSILGFASGVMIAASFFSLLLPSLEEAQEQNLSYPYWIPTLVGFLLGCFFLFVLDLLVPYIVTAQNKEVENRAEDDLEDENRGTTILDVETIKTDVSEVENRKSEVLEDENKKSEVLESDYETLKNKTKKAFKLFLAVTVHNIPEGVACGLVFGSAHNQKGSDQANALSTAIGLAIGIGIQNIPEGAAISLPMKDTTGSNLKGFLYGMFSGIVEPIFALLALLLSTQLKTIDPWALAFAAGAMIYVTVEELIPEAQTGGYPKLAIWFFVLGFVIMMILEFCL